MMIQLPNGKKVELEENINIEDKIIKIEKIISEWEHIFEEGWFIDTIIFFLDGLSNYLVWHKEQEFVGKEDKDVLSIWKVEEMEGIRAPICIPFTYLSYSNKESLGMEDIKK